MKKQPTKRKKRPKDINQLAKSIVDEVVGESGDGEPKKSPGGDHPLPKKSTQSLAGQSDR